MTLSKFILNAPILTAILTAAPAHAMLGNSSGGGGKGVVCRNADQSVKSVELLDLWEGRELRHQLPVVAKGSLAEQVDAGLQDLVQSYPAMISAPDCKNESCLLGMLRDTAKDFLQPSPRVELLTGVKLAPTDDALELAQPEACEIEQIVNYQPANSPALLNQDLFSMMDQTNQAALIVHESYYRVLRTLANEQNSLRVRRAVAFVFSGHRFENTLYDWAGGFECSSPAAVDSWGEMLHFSPDLTKVYFSSVKGTALIGEGPAAITSPDANLEATPAYMKKFFSNQCEVTSDELQWENFSGPVEYDRSISLYRSCEKGKVKFTLETKAPGEKEAFKSAVTCRRVK